MNTYGYRNSTPRQQPTQTERIYRLLSELGDELASFIPKNCNPMFATAIMGARQAIKGLKSFF